MDSFFKKENRFPCPPDFNELKNYVKEFSDVYESADIENANAMISCVEDYLNLYNMLVTGNPPEDNLVKRLHSKTIELLNKAKESRKYQKKRLENKITGYEYDFFMNCSDEDIRDEEKISYCEDLENSIHRGKDILKGFDYDFKVINEIKDFCKDRKTTPEKILCIEKFVNAAHERGPYIPIGCGGYLPEYLSETLEEDESQTIVEEITPEVEDETQKVLDCLKNYKP